MNFCPKIETYKTDAKLAKDYIRKENYKKLKELQAKIFEKEYHVKIMAELKSQYDIDVYMRILYN